jgi:hypothetical protein
VTSCNDIYNGYFIPKGTIVIGNAWSAISCVSCCTMLLSSLDRAILHNPKDYPDPETFNPLQYLTQDGTLDPSVCDLHTACFSFGQCICPGWHLADTSLFTAVSTLLATVNIVCPKDADGKEIVSQVDVTSGILSHLKPFPWAAHPHSRHAELLLSHALMSH